MTAHFHLPSMPGRRTSGSEQYMTAQRGYVAMYRKSCRRVGFSGQSMLKPPSSSAASTSWFFRCASPYMELRYHRSNWAKVTFVSAPGQEATFISTAGAEGTFVSPAAQATFDLMSLLMSSTFTWSSNFGLPSPSSACLSSPSSLAAGLVMARTTSESSFAVGSWPRLRSSASISWMSMVPSPLASMCSKTRWTSSLRRSSLRRYHFANSWKVSVCFSVSVSLAKTSETPQPGVGAQPRDFMNSLNSSSLMEPSPSLSIFSKASLRVSFISENTARPAVSVTAPRCVMSSAMPQRMVDGCDRLTTFFFGSSAFSSSGFSGLTLDSFLLTHFSALSLMIMKLQ
mmetsp:Transcript_14312/g.45022  ORF Transcript_14312/g.45022 Transcript_14312/m.45022 type:complete len:342 (+) Transcript_14312:709-1734(+)